jgi:hypothetical protein
LTEVELKKRWQSYGSSKASVDVVVEQCCCNRFQVVSNLRRWSAIPSLEESLRLRKVVNVLKKEVVFSRANLSWKAFQMADGVLFVVMISIHWESTVSRK